MVLVVLDFIILKVIAVPSYFYCAFLFLLCPFLPSVKGVRHRIYAQMVVFILCSYTVHTVIALRKMCATQGILSLLLSYYKHYLFRQFPVHRLPLLCNWGMVQQNAFPQASPHLKPMSSDVPLRLLTDVQ